MEIGGADYPIKSDADQAYVQRLTRLVDGKVREARRGAKTASPQALAVLAAMQIADELVLTQQAHAALRDAVRQRSRALRALVQPRPVSA